MDYNIIITAGGTSEPIDNVRKITNTGSGKLGSVIADKLIQLKSEKINKIYYICAKGSYKPTSKNIEIIEIVSANDLANAITSLLQNEKIDYFIHTMAVSDYTVDYITTAEKLAEEIKNSTPYDVLCNYKNGIKENKISSNEDNLIIKLKRTPKIISLIKNVSPTTFLVGFKLLDHVSESNLIDVAIKLKEKNSCDLVVANDLQNINENQHKAFIIKNKSDYKTAFTKEEIAETLINEIMPLGT